MKFKSLLKRFFLGQELINLVYSPINGEIGVYEDLFRQRWIKVGGLTQSGGGMDQVSRRLVGEVRKRGRTLETVLILGLSGGGQARMIKELWPKAQITAVELDPTMVSLGMRYFGLDKLNGLKILVGDALELVKSGKLKGLGKYDLIVVDIYLGMDFPTAQVADPRFFHHLKLLLKDQGLVVFNKLNWGEHRQDTPGLAKKINQSFRSSWTVKTASNLLVFASIA